jgi:hemerythrin-like domain-containing protein
MKPTGPLMIEHRLIDRMLALLALEHRRLVESNKINYEFLDTSIDFLKTYVDKFHHGKEEDILFRELAEKPLSSEDRKMLNELIEEHGRTRKVVDGLDTARRQQANEKNVIREITKQIETLTKWYSIHIEKEDKHFFVSSMNYLSEQEQATMLEKSREFDRKFTQHRFEDTIKGLEAAKK